MVRHGLAKLVVFGLCAAWVFSGTCLAAQAGKSPVKVFILVGQSNMQGRGSVEHLRQLVSDPATKDKYAHLVDENGQWVVRDDVWIWFFDRMGGLTVGYGAPADKRFGPELEFGHVVGDALENQVLLLKIAWGGKSLAIDFRPPSSGKIPYELSKKLQEKIDSGQVVVGRYYHEVIKYVREVLGNLKEYFPDYDGGGYEIAGFVWFQGWNDRINQKFNDEYEKNLANLIRDIRRDLGVKDLPFVIGETGQGGVNVKHPRAISLMRAQAAVAQYDEFKQTVRFVETKCYYKENPRYDGGYHFSGNAETFFDIGHAMGKAMLELLGLAPKQ